MCLWENRGFPLGEQGLPLVEQRVSIWENRDFSLGEQEFPSGRIGNSLRKTGIFLWEIRGSLWDKISIPLGVQWVAAGRTDVIPLGEQGFSLEDQEYPSRRTGFPSGRTGSSL